MTLLGRGVAGASVLFEFEFELIYFDNSSKITIHHLVGWPRKTYLTVTIKDLQRACTNSSLADPVNRNLGLSVRRPISEQEKWPKFL